MNASGLGRQPLQEQNTYRECKVHLIDLVIIHVREVVFIIWYKYSIFVISAFLDIGASKKGDI